MSASTFTFPASFAQKRLWFLDRFEPGTPLYNIVAAARWRGGLSQAALRQALEDVIARHEALRTTFKSENGEPMQVVHPHLPAQWVWLDLSSLEVGRDQAAERCRHLGASRGFDLERGPLLRLFLIRLSDEVHEVMLVVHHIVFDGVSLGIFLRELGVAYAARCRGDVPSWPELPIQYVDYTHWQREWLQGEVLDEMVDYWRQRLAGAPAVIELPNDRSRLPVQTYRGHSWGLRLNGALVDQADRLARHEGVSLFMVLLSAFMLLLRRHTGQTDLVVGTPVANRDRLEIEGLIGLFVNSLVLRGDLGGDPTVREVLARIRSSALDAYAHQDIPFEKLVEELKPARNLSHNPLYQQVFGWHDGGRPEWVLGGLESEDLPVDSGTAKFDLSFFLERTARGVQGVIEYASELFDKATVWRLGRHFEHLLGGLVVNPSVPISQCEYLSPAERHQLGWEWSAGAEWSPDLVSVWVVEGFEHQARIRPTHPAVELEGAVLTYGELDHQANVLAARLLALGVGPDVPVALCLERSPILIVAMFATLKAGGAFLPLDPSYPADRIAFMLEDSKAPVVLTQRSLVDGLPAASGAAHLALDDPALDASLRGTDRSEAERALQARRRPRSGNLAYVIYTSGSTGKPKGTMISHGAFTAYLRIASRSYGMVPSDRVLQFCSISFDISLEEIYPCLTHGGTLVLRTDEMVSSIAVFLERCREWGLTFLSLPTAYWHEIVDGMRERGLTLPPDLRLVIIAGERALPERLTEWRRHQRTYPRLVNTYGLTESTIISTICDLGGTVESMAGMREVPIGRAIEGSELLLLDRHLLPVPIGVIGQIHIGGALLGRGYLGRPRITADRYVPHMRGGRPGERLYRTGDLARYLTSGDLEFLGRADHQVKISGYRIEPGEIEAACVAHPAIEETVVMVREATPGDKRLVAYLLAHAERPSSADLRSFLNERLPVYMLPSQLIFMDEWPLTPNGKINRSALPEPSGERPDLEASYVAPRGEMEALLAGVWQEIFGVDRVGIHDNFFDLGGHSLLMVQVQSRLTQKLGRDVPILDLFQHPTIASLAAHWSLADSAESSRAERSRDRAELQRSLRQDRFSRARRRRS